MTKARVQPLLCLGSLLILFWFVVCGDFVVVGFDWLVWFFLVGVFCIFWLVGCIFLFVDLGFFLALYWVNHFPACVSVFPAVKV